MAPCQSPAAGLGQDDQSRPRGGLLVLWLACLGAGALLGSLDRPRPSEAAAEASFEFILMGDTPYSKLEELCFEPMLAEIGRGEFSFVVHVGDFKSGGSPYARTSCSVSVSRFFNGPAIPSSSSSGTTNGRTATGRVPEAMNR